MPFDSTDYTELKPSLALLSEILRDPTRWPEGFKWDYRLCKTCAIGLADRLWPDRIGLADLLNSHPATGTSYGLMAEIFNMPVDIAREIFLYLGSPGDMGLIAPYHVADAIDEYLAANG